MEPLSVDEQFVSDLPPDQQQDYLISFDIVQDAKFTNAQLKFRKRVRPKSLDSSRQGCGLIHESCLDCGFE
jgi:hypothetical protein